MIPSLKDTVWHQIELKDLPSVAKSQDKLKHYYNKAKELYDQEVINFEKGKKCFN